MSLSASGRTWEEASSPAAVRLARRFEAAWRDSTERRPDPDDFLPDDVRDYPGARLALLRADMSLRRESGHPVGAEWYRDRYTALDDEILVALIYEEFCLREEEEGTPDPAEFLARFPEVASQLRRVFDIHGLVGSGPTTTASLHGACSSVAFPETGQTIAGFHLVEELGRGAFARVFLARERQLADRPVALKVARSGSREPQTLARLQHTHIVPVHSSRTDPATGLHLLCMPYFGRLTLARVLADPDVREAHTGAELIETLDRLGSPGGPPSGRSAGRAALARRTYAQAIAWWGARMAEALERAHDRGVLHRDIKPSNVLVTGDGMPMLLDFNLAPESVRDDPETAPAALGGTLDYMAPEHLDALADGEGDRLDARADIYGLGVLLHEALAGARPFETPRKAASATELLLRAAEERRRDPPRLRATRPEVPAALEAVVRRCLAPDPDDRYASAADLAVDLQAVADDLPLRFAREPIPGRILRGLRRHRRALAMSVPVVAALVVLGASLVMGRIAKAQRRDEVAQLIAQGKEAYVHNEFAKALAQFNSAARMSEGRHDLEDLFRTARERSVLAEQTGTIRDQADALFRASVPLRFRLIGFGGDLASASRDLPELLKPFFVLVNANWTRRADLTLLDEPRRLRLIDEVNDLLYLWVVALDRSNDPEAIRHAVAICERALIFADPKGPWDAFLAHLRAEQGAGPPAPDSDAVALSTETSALACYQWGLLRASEHRHAQAIAWLKKAVRLAPGAYWYHYYLAYENDRSENHTDVSVLEALRHYDAAFALRPDLPWVRFSRARLYRQRGAWSLALDELRRSLVDARALPALARDPSFEGRARLEMGLIHQWIGDAPAARAEYEAAIASDPTGDYARAAQLNRANLDAETGKVERALATYEELLSERPDDRSARLSRALLSLRLGRAAAAEADLGLLIEKATRPEAELRAHRAQARLLLGRAAEADLDAVEAVRLEPDPGHERLRTRTLLALGRVRDLPLDAPEAWTRLPVSGPSLASDLRNAAERLRTDRPTSDADALRALLTRALILTALGDAEAESEATRAVALAPMSGQVYLVRSWVRHHRGALGEALADVARGLALEPDNPRLWHERGRLHRASGDLRSALADLDRALHLGADGSARDRSAVLLALGNAEGAVRDASVALSLDPDNPRAFLGRARALLRLRQWDPALADLEQAAGWADGQPGLLLEIALAYARCLPTHPERSRRVVALALRACSAAVATRPR